MSSTSKNEDFEDLPNIPLEISNVCNLPRQPMGVRYDIANSRDLNPDIPEDHPPVDWVPIKGKSKGTFLKFKWACDLVNYSHRVADDGTFRFGTPQYKIVGFLGEDPVAQVRSTSYIAKMSKGAEWTIQTLSGSVYTLSYDGDTT
jgi:hypothetical protein